MAPGQILSGLTLVERIGTGGMGEVWRAQNARAKTIWRAVKIIRPELASAPGFAERFLREAETLELLRHQHILRVDHLAEEDGRLFMVMELLQGRPLSDFAQGGQPLPLPMVADLMSQALRGIAHAHRHNVIHRDLKPANFFVTLEGEVKVLDFGIAQIGDGVRLTRTGASVPGSPAYYAPELVQGKPATSSSDLYSVAISIYELLAGELPFQAQGQTDTQAALSLMFHHVHTPLPDIRTVRSDVPEAFARVLSKAAAKDPAQRYETAAEMAAVLETFSGSWPRGLLAAAGLAREGSETPVGRNTPAQRAAAPRELSTQFDIPDMAGKRAAPAQAQSGASTSFSIPARDPQKSAPPEPAERPAPPPRAAAPRPPAPPPPHAAAARPPAPPPPPREPPPPRQAFAPVAPKAAPPPEPPRPATPPAKTARLPPPPPSDLTLPEPPRAAPAPPASAAPEKPALPPPAKRSRRAPLALALVALTAAVALGVTVRVRTLAHDRAGPGNTPAGAPQAGGPPAAPAPPQPEGGATSPAPPKEEQGKAKAGRNSGTEERKVADAAPAAKPEQAPRDAGAAGRLLEEGNRKLTAEDLAAALTLYRKALALHPSGPVRAGLYRSMGIAFTRQGNIDEGARYYRRYLPLCTNEAEKKQLEKVLADYDARKSGDGSSSSRSEEEKAARLAADAQAKLNARDFQSAVDLSKSALALHPKDQGTLDRIYRNFGYAYAYLNDRAEAVKWLKLYQPRAGEDKAAVDQFIGTSEAK